MKIPDRWESEGWKSYAMGIPEETLKEILTNIKYRYYILEPDLSTDYIPQISVVETGSAFAYRYRLTEEQYWQIKRPLKHIELHKMKFLIKLEQEILKISSNIPNKIYFMSSSRKSGKTWILSKYLKYYQANGIRPIP